MSNEFPISAGDRLRNGFLSSAEALLSTVRKLERLPANLDKISQTAEQANQAQLPKTLEKTAVTIQRAAVGGVAIVGVLGLVWIARGGGHHERR